MKEKRLIILNKLSKGEITSEQADKELLLLFSDSVSSVCKDDDFNEIAIKVQDVWQMSGLSDTIYENYARQCFIAYFKKLESY